MLRNKVRSKIPAVTVLALLIIGCNAAQWFQLIDSLLPLAIQVAAQFYSYANHGAVSAEDQALIQEYSSSAKNILQTIQNAVNAVQNPADISAIQKVDALLRQLQNESDVLLTSLHVKDANTIAFVKAMLADAADLAALVPVIPTAGSPAKTRAIISGQIRQAMPRAKSLQDVFKARLENLPK